MREIVFDTETTGLDPANGDRVIEIGCVELVNRITTGTHFHRYLNPERDIAQAAVAVHGLTVDFLSDQPLFAEVVEEFLEFVGDAPLVAHNADFDMRFINAELDRAGHPTLLPARFVDTLVLARERFPGQQNSLDALCRRMGVDNSNRTLHGALLDSQLLAEVYLELTGGRQAGLALDVAAQGPSAARVRKQRAPRPHAPSASEKAAHDAFVAALPDAIWLR